MSAADEELYSQMLRVENKDVFVDLRKNASGIYLKLSERRGNQRKTVLIPASGIARLQAALEEANTHVQESSKSAPGKARSEGKAAAPTASAGPVRTVYVSGLPWTTTDLELAAHFSKAGKVVKATVLTQTRRGRVLSSGNALVEFNTTREAESAIKQFHDTELGGRIISCREDRKSLEPQAEEETESPAGKLEAPKVVVPNKVYIRNLSWSTADTSLLQAFGLAGHVIEAKVNLSRSGRSLGTGLVEYTDANSALKAIEMLNGKDLDGRKITVREYYEE